VAERTHGPDPQQLRRSRLAGVDAAIDAALAVVEDANLDSRHALIPRVRAGLLTSLRASLGPPPAQVVLAMHPVQLHGALLDWHGALLDALFPERHEHDEPAHVFIVDMEDVTAAKASPSSG
jgi:hypothetical protein